MAVLIVWGGLLLAEKVYEMVTEQQEQQRRATAARIQQRRLRDEEEWQLTQPRTLLNEERSTWTGPQPPQEYICPISLELMRDPVIIETGQTFDRYAHRQVHTCALQCLTQGVYQLVVCAWTSQLSPHQPPAAVGRGVQQHPAGAGDCPLEKRGNAANGQAKHRRLDQQGIVGDLSI